MNINDMDIKELDIEQMRNAWVEMGKVLEADTRPSNPTNMNNMNTNLDKLRTRYLRGWKFSFTAGILLAAGVFLNPSINSEYRLPLSISYIILMLANGYVLYKLWCGLEKINPLTMPITQVCTLANYYKKYHMLYYMLFIPIVIVWSGYYMFAILGKDIGGRNSLIIGCIAGGFSGLCAIYLYLRDYRNLTK